MFCPAFSEAEGNDIGDIFTGNQLHKGRFIELRLVKLSKGVSKKHQIPGAEQEEIAVLEKSIVIRFGTHAVKVHPHQAPRGISAAFVGIRPGAVQPYTVSGRDGIVFIFIGNGTTAVQYHEKQIGTQILSLTDMRFQTLQRSYLLYIEVMFLCIGGRSEIIRLEEDFAIGIYAFLLKIYWEK